MKNLTADLWIMRPAHFIGFIFIMIGVLCAFYCCRLRFEALLASKISALQMMTFESAIVQETMSSSTREERYSEAPNNLEVAARAK